MAGRRPTGRGGRGQQSGPPSPPPPHPPPQLEGHRGDPPPPPSRRDAPPPPEGTATPGGGDAARPAHRVPQRPQPPAPVPHQRAGAARGSTLGTAHGGAPEQYGGRAPHDPPHDHCPLREGRGRVQVRRGLQGSGPRAAPHPPPPPERPSEPRPNAHAGGECTDHKRGARVGNRGPPPRGGAGRPRRDPPPEPPHRPASRGGAGPRPPRQGGWSPLPPPEGGAGARPVLPPQPPAPTGTAGSKRARANAPGRSTDRAQRRRVSTNRSGMGTTPPVTRTTPVTPALLPAQGRQRDGTRQSEPPPYWPPRAHKRGARRTGRPPPPKTQAPAEERHGPAPRGAHSPKPGRGEPGPDRPPPKHARRSKGPGQDTRRGTDHVERPYQRPVPGPCEVRTPHHPGGGGADAAGAQAHTHAKGTRGLPEGQPDRARQTHEPRGMAYQRARVRDTRTGRPPTRSAGHAGRDGGNGRDTTPGTGPSPPNCPRAPRTHRRGTAPAKALVAHCATPQPLG